VLSKKKCLVNQSSELAARLEYMSFQQKECLISVLFIRKLIQLINMGLNKGNSTLNIDYKILLINTKEDASYI